MAASLTPARTASAAELRRLLVAAMAVVGVMLLTGATTSLPELLTGQQLSDASVDATTRAAFAILYAGAVAVLITYWRKSLALALSHWPLILLMVLAVASAAWSIDGATTLRRAIGLMGTTAFGVMLAVTFDIRQWVGLVAIGILAIAVLSLLTIAIRPDYGIMTGLHDGAWRGILVHKNILGHTMALGVIAAASWRPERFAGRLLAWFALALCLPLLTLSLSRTAWVLVAIVAMAAVLAIVLRSRLSILLPLSVGGVFAFVAVSVVLISALDDLTAVIGRDLTLTGRTFIWLAVVASIASRPLLGFGYGAFWSSDAGRTVMGASQPGFVPHHAHNGWLEVALGVGSLGLFLVIVSGIVITVRTVKSYRLRPNEITIFPLLFLVLLLLLSTVESVLLRENSIFWALYSATAVAVSLNSRTAASSLNRTVR